MSDAPLTTLHAFRCARCDALVVSHEPPQIMRVHENKRTTDHLLCIECGDEISWGSWPDEDWGPYQWRVTHHRSYQAGHA